MVIARRELQLVGCACMLISAKYEEMRPPSVMQLVDLTDNTYEAEEVLEMEAKVLRTISFMCTMSTPKLFMTRFLRAALSDEVEASLAKVRGGPFPRRLLQRAEFHTTTSSYSTCWSCRCSTTRCCASATPCGRRPPCTWPASR